MPPKVFAKPSVKKNFLLTNIPQFTIFADLFDWWDFPGMERVCQNSTFSGIVWVYDLATFDCKIVSSQNRQNPGKRVKEKLNPLKP